MGHLMPQPWKHPKTGMYWFRKTVPEPLRPIVDRREIKFSLDTKDPREAKLRYPEAAARAHAILEQARGGRTRLSQKQVFALAGEWFRRELKQREEDPGNPLYWDDQLGALQDIWEDSLTEEYLRFRWKKAQKLGAGSEPEEKYRNWDYLEVVRKDVDRLLAAEALSVDEDTYRRLAEQLFEQKGWLYATLARRARGDYGPIEQIENAPPWDRPSAKPKHVGARVTLLSLVELWARERE